MSRALQFRGNNSSSIAQKAAIIGFETACMIAGTGAAFSSGDGTGPANTGRMVLLIVWTPIVPFAMFLNFVFLIIPAHDAYLASRYADEFKEFARRSWKLIPFVY